MKNRNNDPCSIREAKPDDLLMILTFIRELAEYEKLADQVTADEQLLRYWLFEKKTAEALILEIDDQAVGFALFFHNFSTFVGKAGIYLEDLYVLPKYRNCGIGKAAMNYLARLALERNCGRLEWSCLNWNQSAIDFYHSLGAFPLEEWTTFRLDEEALHHLVGK